MVRAVWEMDTTEYAYDSAEKNADFTSTELFDGRSSRLPITVKIYLGGHCRIHRKSAEL
jgi:hypothetical protein